MKRQILTALLATASIATFAQDADLPTIKGDTLYTSSGFKIGKNQDLKMGTGSMPDGSFKFIRRNSASMFNYTSNTGRQDLANQANALPRNSAGLKYKALRLEKRGREKTGYVYYVVLGTGMVKYEVDVENAIAAGEIDVPDEFLPKRKETIVTVKSEVSVADEIKKLKDLYDQGILTKEEFEAQKKKLLEKN